jgi:hypothetical protein
MQTLRKPLALIGTLVLLLTLAALQPSADVTVVVGQPAAGGGGTTGGGSGIPTWILAGASNAVQATSLTLTLPAHADGSFLLAAVGEGGGQAITGPAGWTEIGTQVTDGSIVAGSAWFKRATSGSETNPQFTVPISSDVFFGVVVVYSNVVTSGTPYEDFTQVAVTSTTTPQSAAIDTTSTDRLAICINFQDNNLTPWNGHPPANWTNSLPVSDHSTAVGADFRINIMHQGVASASTVAAVTIGTLNVAEENASMTFALLPD